VTVTATAYGVALDSVPGDLQPAGVPASGSTGKSADGAHVHPQGLMPSGDTTGATDTANIQALINLGTQAVRLAWGVFWTNADLLPRPGTVIEGSGGFDPIVSGDQGTVIKAVSGFGGTAMITCNDVSHAVTQGPLLRDFSLDGTALTATIDGVRAFGPVNGGVMEDFYVAGVTGAGWNGVIDSAVSSGQAYPYGWRARRVKINTTGAQGIVCSNHTDGTWIDVHTINTAGHGWSIAGATPNSRYIACKAEWTGAGKDGFHLTSAWSSGTGSGGAVFLGISTDRCDGNGMSITATGDVPVVVVGAMFRRDGRNSGSGGGGYAGLSTAGATVPVITTGTMVWPGEDDNGSSSPSPQYGASITNSSCVTLSGGYIQGVSAAIHNGGGNTSPYPYIGQDVVQATGTTASPALSYGPLAVLFGGTGSTSGGGGGGAVASVNGKTGTVVLGAADVGADASGAAAAAQSAAETYAAAQASAAQSAAESFATSAVGTETTRAETAEALLAPKASPALTGTPTAPTATALTASTQLATTAYTDSAVAVEVARAETAEALKAPLASPALTGSPTAPTKTPLTNNTDLATTAYADAAVGVETSRAETAEALKAPLASPALTGTPTAPTATALTGNTQVATTAYSDSATAVEKARAMAAEALALPLAGGTMTGWLAPAVVALTFGSSIAVNAALGNVFAVTLTASTGTLANPSGPVDGQVIRIRVTQDATGSRTLAYGTAFDFGTAGTPVLTATASKTDILAFEYVAALSKWCYIGCGLGY
jgi:hypothetical protein